MTRVKICGLTRLQDAELAVELGADAFGVIFEPSSPRYALRHPNAACIGTDLGPFASTVAVYGDYPSATRDVGFALVQLISGDAGPRKHVRVFRFRDGVSSDSAVEQIGEQSGMAAVVLDAFSHHALGGTGRSVDWDFAAEIVRRLRYPVILAGGLTPENVASAIEIVRPYAVDVSSGVEVEGKPGIKDPIKMRDFIQAAKSAR